MIEGRLYGVLVASGDFRGRWQLSFPDLTLPGTQQTERVFSFTVDMATELFNQNGYLAFLQGGTATLAGTRRVL